MRIVCEPKANHSRSLKQLYLATIENAIGTFLKLAQRKGFKMLYKITVDGFGVDEWYSTGGIESVRAEAKKQFKGKSVRVTLVGRM